MKCILTGLRNAASLALLAGAMAVGSSAATYANVTLSSIVPYTKVDPQYQELQELYARFHKQNPDIRPRTAEASPRVSWLPQS